MKIRRLTFVFRVHLAALCCQISNKGHPESLFKEYPKLITQFHYHLYYP